VNHWIFSSTAHHSQKKSLTSCMNASTETTRQLVFLCHTLAWHGSPKVLLQSKPVSLGTKCTFWSLLSVSYYCTMVFARRICMDLTECCLGRIYVMPWNLTGQAEEDHNLLPSE
jgi:hypothetical protein